MGLVELLDCRERVSSLSVLRLLHKLWIKVKVLLLLLLLLKPLVELELLLLMV